MEVTGYDVNEIPSDSELLDISYDPEGSANSSSSEENHSHCYRQPASNTKSNLSPPPSKKKKGGRIKDLVWEEFVKIETEKNLWMCKYCDKEIKYPQPDRLRKHLEKCSASRKVKRPSQSVSVPVSSDAVSEPDLLNQNQIKIQKKMPDYFFKTTEPQQRRISQKLMRFICSANISRRRK